MLCAGAVAFDMNSYSVLSTKPEKKSDDIYKSGTVPVALTSEFVTTTFSDDFVNARLPAEAASLATICNLVEIVPSYLPLSYNQNERSLFDVFPSNLRHY